MSNPSPTPGGAIGARVHERLAQAGAAFDRAARATRPGKKHPPLKLVTDATAPNARHSRERACLRAVFQELGDAHREYRRRTGQSVSPGLRAATTSFKQEPSERTLVPVAAALDELGILPW